jgi:hypothetical protein
MELTANRGKQPNSGTWYDQVTKLRSVFMLATVGANTAAVEKDLSRAEG